MTNDLSLSQLLARCSQAWQVLCGKVKYEPLASKGAWITSDPDIPFPTQAKRRSGEWKYVGWISNPPGPFASYTFDEFVEKAKRSDHGEIREVDIYEWGAVCWVKESKC